eukprot:3715623-Rhodomonas_salina.1
MTTAPKSLLLDHDDNDDDDLGCSAQFSSSRQPSSSLQVRVQATAVRTCGARCPAEVAETRGPVTSGPRV